MIRRIIDFLLFSSIFISFGAFTIVHRTFLISSLTPTLEISFFAFFSTLFTYNLTKVVPLYLRTNSSDYAYNERNKWNLNQTKLLITITVVSGLISGLLFVKLNFSQQLFISHLGLVSVFYTVPIYRGKTLRDISFLKIFLIAYVWASTSILPIIEFGFTISTFYIFINNLLFIFAITLPFDIRDFERDQSKSLKTIPQSIGINWTKILSALLLLLSLTFTSAIEMFPEIAVAFVSVLLILFSSKKNSEYYFLGLIDGLIILKWLILLIYP